jgi:hypothetical protein
MALAALAAAAMPGLSAEVLPHPGSLGDWVERNNRARRPKRAHKAKPQLNKRLAPATGPGSINAESEMQALVRAGKHKEAAEFYEACHRIHYKHGKPKMRWGGHWYLEYKRTAGVGA